MNNNKPFGGKLVIFGGDFRQTLSIVEHGSKHQEIDLCVKSSELWPGINIRSLTENMRVKTLMRGDTETKERLTNWSEYLLSVGNGEETNKVAAEIKKKFIKKDIIKLPKNIISKSTTPEELIKEIYPNLNQYINVENIKNSAILTPLNKDVDMLNKKAMECVREEAKICYSSDSVVDEAHVETYPEEYLNGLNVSGLPVHELILKKGVPIMLMRNLSPINGCCNGTRCLVEHVGTYHLRTRILSGLKKNIGKIYIIPRITLQSKPGNFAGFQLKRKQFPVRVCFAFTINKSQGQTLKNVGLYLPRPCFGHGQLYVALSRVGDPNFIKVVAHKTCNQGEINGETYTRNVVYKEVLF